MIVEMASRTEGHQITRGVIARIIVTVMDGHPESIAFTQG
jgi:hypothetical protein